MKYLSNKAPKKYACGACGAKGIKLWRDVCCCASQVDLRCASCMNCGDVDEGGYFIHKQYGIKTDQCTTDELGSMVPAVPTECEDTYWGYTSVPDDGVRWWRSLPNKKIDILDKIRNMIARQ